MSTSLFVSVPTFQTIANGVTVRPSGNWKKIPAVGCVSGYLTVEFSTAADITF